MILTNEHPTSSTKSVHLHEMDRSNGPSNYSYPTTYENRTNPESAASSYRPHGKYDLQGVESA